jgi:multidrug efflux pump
VNPADSPIIILGLTSDKYDKPTLYDEASSVIAQKLSQIAGVGQVTVGGGAGPSVRVEVNPTLLNSHGLTIQNVQSVLSQQNATSRPAKSQTELQPPISSPTTRSPADQYKPLIVGYNNGAAVRLADVADVSDSAQNIRTAGYLNGTPSITIMIFRQPGANIIDTVDRVRAELPSIKHPFRKASRPPSFSTAPPPSAPRSAMWSAPSSSLSSW